MKLSLKLGILLLLLLPFSFAKDLFVAVASNFNQPAQELAVKFKQETGIKVIIAAASTGVLATQIKNGAPYAVLLAADSQTPSQLITDGYAVADTQFTYANGQLVLWSLTPNFVDKDGKVLTSAKFTHLAIANPKLAPYGKAAYDLLAKLKLNDKLAPKIVTGDNINNTYQYVASGNAKLGFVALAQVYQNGKLSNGSMWLVPTSLIPLIKQDAVLLNLGKQSSEAKQFLQFLQSPAARKIITSYGYK